MLDIYISRAPSNYVEEPVYPLKRQEIIENTKNADVRRERYCVWKLLEYAVKNSIGKTIEEIEPHLDENGKWLSDECWFSLSHSDGVLAVAISDAPVGIDIEGVRDVDFGAFFRRILTSAERTELENVENAGERIIELWSRKESVYKMIGTPPFIPSLIECKEYPVLTYMRKIDNKKRFISVCSDKLKDAKVIDDVIL